MLCAKCFARRMWPDDFPHPVYGICADCFPVWSAGRPCFLVRWWRAIVR